MDRNLRLRIHVRRNGLPENNILFNIPLINDPTIANLLEIINETIPLEDADGEWGLDDYVVEVHDKDPLGQGNAFECLHFQPLAGLLEKDDEVFIRPLLTTDLKKRRLSGRDQILPGGEHIIDGVPFGRPRLRAPRGRPPVAIAPRKRRRLLDDRECHSGYDDDLGDDDYSDPGNSGRLQQLLLTRHGENSSIPTRQVRFVPGPSPGSGEASDDDLSSVQECSEQEEDEDDDVIEPSAQELADELADLRRELTEEEENHRSKTKSRSRSRSETVASDYPRRRSGSNNNAFGSRGVGQDAKDIPPAPDLAPDLAVLDKVVAVRAAFNVSHEDAVKLLLKHNKDVSKVWRALERSLKPRQGLAETMVLATQLELPREVQIMSSPVRSPVNTFGNISRIDDDEQAESMSSDEDDSSDDSDEGFDENEPAPGVTESNSEEDSDNSSEYVSARPSPPLDDVVDDSVSSSEDSSSDDENAQGSTKSSNVQSKQTKTQSRTITLPEAQQDDVSDSSDASDSSFEEETPVALRNKEHRPQKISSSASDSSSSSGTSSDSSSDSNSDSDSDSDSDSGSGSEIDKANIITTAHSKSFPNNELTEKGHPGPEQRNMQQKALVPPGQGLTRTQRRNQRRRLQIQARKAALQSSNHSQNTQDAPINDLEAKKKALLETLTTKSNVLDGGPGQLTDDVQMADEDQNAWRNKISYRAVECVQEGVELSEPPFPFVQRWDPQQRWDSQPSQRRGKRKSRADSQFYDDANSHNSKKRRFGQPVDEYYYHEDTTTLLAHQEDIELDYDDATFNPDEDPMANGFNSHSSRHTGEQAMDDLPSLPEDMSSLPILNAVDLKLGMVIAWKQLLCTEATQWQPQISDYLTASITEFRNGSAGFEVQLARRDRNIDRNVKKYDEETGQRIYGKFEAPDSDEDRDDDGPEEEDDGIREVSFAEMIEPRIVQQAVEANGVDRTSENLTEQGSSNCKAPDSAASQMPELGFEVADSQPEERIRVKYPSGKRTESNELSGTYANDQGTEPEQHTMHSMNHDADATVEESLIPETVHDAADFPAEEVSITEDFRGETSELINRGGFSQEVRSSIDHSAFLQFGQGSPSRQLEEEYASSILLTNRKGASRSSSSSGAPSEYHTRAPMHYKTTQLDTDSAQPSKLSSFNGLQSLSQQKVSHAPAALGEDMFVSNPQNPILQQARSNRLGEEDSTRLTTPGEQHSNRKMECPNTDMSQTTQSSTLSGKRQLDPNFITPSDDLGISVHDDGNALGGDSADFEQLEHERTLTQQIQYNEPQNASLSKMSFESNQQDAQPLSRPHSAASDMSDNSFPDIKFLSSQAAKTKFNESTGIKPERSTSQDALATDDLAGQPPRSSQQSEVLAPSRSIKGSPPPMHSTPGTENERLELNGGNANSNSVSFQEPISPPALSRSRQTRASSSSQNISRDKTPVLAQSTDLSSPSNEGPSMDSAKRKTKTNSVRVTKGSQAVNPIASKVEPTSNPKPQPEPEPEPEPEYSEMYADDSVDEDYPNSFPKTRKAAATRRTSQVGLRKRRASVSAAESKEENIGPGWVGGSQGPSRKASGRFGGRVSSTGGF
ncbi:hypothetical protein N0V93_000618 [Gnomoniopsis smithogilvyi]|uniref:DUF7357 domain-containing protein n=1 Tax=Gnomoniopsis smithogilvyi TaxID=1191159 RepID=A0A9W8Z0H9_9PEZI|nr:hypothetical protein N0V93_000618 [Gnomoniopsis smithogilvyi]